MPDSTDKNKPSQTSEAQSIDPQPPGLTGPLQTVGELIESDALNEALKLLRKLSSEYGNEPEICFVWGHYHEKKREWNDAVHWYKKAAGLNPLNTNYHNRLVELLLTHRREDEAIQALLNATRSVSAPLPYYRWLENVYVQRRDQAGVASMVAEIKERFAGQPELLYVMGEAALASRLYSSAIDFFRQCYDRHYIGEAIEFYLATAFAFFHEKSFALHFFRRALRRNPDHVAALDGLHDMLLRRSDIHDNKLIAAVEWRRSTAAHRLQPLVQLDLLQTEACNHAAVFEDWLKAEDTPSDSYLCFCEYYRDLLEDHSEAINHLYSPIDSLLACVAHLTLTGDELHALYYKAWHYHLTKNNEAATPIFQMLLTRKDLPENTRGNCTYVLSDIGAPLEASPKRREEAEKKSSTRQSKKPSQEYDSVGFDLTALVRQESPQALNIDATIVRRICQVFDTNAGRGIILVGPSGVGKTAAVRQLAKALQTKDVPDSLRNFCICQTSTTRLLSDTKYIGTWQKNVETLCESANVKKRTIIYFEDLANVLTAGATMGDSSSFIDYLIPRLEAKEIFVIGEMDETQAHRVCDKDPRFARLMHQIVLSEPDATRVQSILRTVADDEGARRSVLFSPESLNEIVDLAATYMPYRAFPGKAVDILRGALDNFGSADRKEPVRLGSQDIVLSFGEQTGIPSGLVDRQQLLDAAQLRQFFGERILGQKEAVDTLVAAVQSFKARMCDPKKPLRSFLFVGPTGVGKTEAAKVLAEYVFGSRDRLVHVNMSEYSDSTGGVNKLIGTHWSDKKTSRFIDTIRSQPFSVVLLDEIEKASGEVRNLLLQLLDEGILVGGDGKATRFQSCFIVMTSNVGARRYSSRSIGFDTETAALEVHDAVMADVKQFFSPEVFNRFDEVVCFRPLTRQVLGTIINREIGKVLERQGVAGSNLSIDIDPLVIDHIITTGFDPLYGARHLKRAIERSVTIPLSSLIVSQKVDRDSEIRVVMREGQPAAVRMTGDYRHSSQLISPRTLRSPSFESGVKDREIIKFLSAAEERIVGLKGLLKIDDAEKEKDQLQQLMTTPTFWDDHAKANQSLKRIAELTRVAERVGRWDHVIEEVRGVTNGSNVRRRREELDQARTSLLRLLEDVESAELEVLLQGKYDSADAFVVLKAEGATKGDIAWLLDLADMYIGWAGRRGYRCIVVGEQPHGQSSGPGILLHICGMNAFGLLKNERGIHQRAVIRKTGNRDHPGSRTVSARIDCRVQVLADLQNSVDKGHLYSLKITRLPATKQGWRLKGLNRKIHLESRNDGARLEFLTDASIERDKELPLDLFISYSHCISNVRTTAGALERQAGSLVRTYESGDRFRVLDHATKTTVTNWQSFLEGNIDPVLLDRLV